MFDHKTNPGVGRCDQRNLRAAQARDAVKRRCFGGRPDVNWSYPSAVQRWAVLGIDDHRPQSVLMRISTNRKPGN